MLHLPLNVYHLCTFLLNQNIYIYFTDLLHQAVLTSQLACWQLTANEHSNGADSLYTCILYLQLAVDENLAYLLSNLYMQAELTV